MNRAKINQNRILKLTFEFSLALIEYCELLTDQKKYVLAKQLLRSGTSIGANAIEAQNGESRADFIHKFKVAAKEAEETEYWLLLCQSSNGFPDNQYLLDMIEVINLVIGKIISTNKAIQSNVA